MEKIAEKKAEDTVFVTERGEESRKTNYFELSNTPGSAVARLPGVRVKGVQYYDFKYVMYVSHCGMAKLIQHVKYLLADGTQIRFINVNDKVKKRLSEVGLDHIIHCT